MFLKSLKIFRRALCSCKANEPILVKSLRIFKHGEPPEVLQITEDQLIATSPNQVLVKILAAPIHTADIDIIRGKSTSNCFRQLEFPITPGQECVAEVRSLASNVTTLNVGQRVVAPYTDSTWTTYALYDAEDLTPIPDGLDIAESATLTVNPCIAYRILKDFMALKPDDCVLLNGSDTPLGMAVHQLCGAWKIKSVGIIHESTQVEEIKEYLQARGASNVLTLKELRKTNIFEDGTLPKPRLALTCVARSSSRELCRYLDNHGVMVAYGCMAGKPVATGTAALIFKDYVQRPFWMMRWSKQYPNIDDRNKMIKEICDLMEKKEFTAPECELVPFEDYKEAIEKQMSHKGPTPKCVILDMQCEE